MDKKQIQQTRIMNYFLDAACKVIEEEGYKELTVRKVADLAGYHYSTIYNYFKDLNHLAAQATIRFFDKCSEYLDSYAKEYTDELDNYRKCWEGFFIYCLEHPSIFRCMFLEDLGDEAREFVIANLFNSLLFRRKREEIKRCTEKNLLPQDKIAQIEEMLLAACIGRVVMHVNKRKKQEKQEVIEGFIRNMDLILNSVK